jgi:Fic family protein
MAWADKLINSPCGRLVTGREGYLAYVPAPLPREMPSLSPGTIYKLDEASRAVALLAGVGETLPNPNLLIRPFLRREAILSSRIEGTVASATDVLKLEAFPDRSIASSEAREVLNYVHALEEGLRLLESLPISTRLITQLHERLMTGVRGRDKRPGEIRQQQVWIVPEGAPIEDARFAPPPAELVPELLKDWETYVNSDDQVPPLIQCALMHYQFEAIHPFLDGNGRIGRLLIVLFLCSKGVLRKPLLYLSAYFERNRDQYYDHLFAISASGEWEPWLRYFLDGVVQEATDALTRSRRLRQLQGEYRDRLQKARHSGNTLRLLDELFASPIVTAPLAAKILNVSPEGARQILDRLVKANILRLDKITWPRYYVADEILRALDE